MKVIKPIALTDANLISSSESETEHAAYSAVASYAVGSRCIYGHKIYESVQTPNTGNQPDLTPLYWAKVSPTNKWAMFDDEVSTQTEAENELTVVIKTDYVNSLAIFGLEGSALSVTVRDGLAGPVVYSKALSLDGTVIVDWYQYFYEPFIQLGEVVLTDLPPYGNAHITITITGAGTVKCGSASAGTVYTLGDAQYGASVSIIDYSRKDTLATGATTFTKRKYSKTMSAQVSLPSAQFNKVYQTLASLRSTPCAWVGVDAAGFEPMIIYGFYRDFAIDIPYPTYDLCNLQIEGLI